MKNVEIEQSGSQSTKICLQEAAICIAAATESRLLCRYSDKTEVTWKISCSSVTKNRNSKVLQAARSECASAPIFPFSSDTASNVTRITSKFETMAVTELSLDAHLVSQRRFNVLLLVSPSLTAFWFSVKSACRFGEASKKWYNAFTCPRQFRTGCIELHEFCKLKFNKWLWQCM